MTDIFAAVAGFAIAIGIVIAQANGPIMEDDPRWDCRTMGNHVCGPNNSQGVAPGYYDHRGELLK